MNAEQPPVSEQSDEDRLTWRERIIPFAVGFGGVALINLGFYSYIAMADKEPAPAVPVAEPTQDTVNNVGAPEPIFAGLPTPTTLPTMDDEGVLSCSTYEYRAEQGFLDEHDYLGVLACERSLRDPRITVVDFAEQSDEQLQAYVDTLDVRGRKLGLFDEPVFTVIPATEEMQQAYQVSRTKVCDIYEHDNDPDTDDVPSTASDIARQFIAQKSYDRLVTLTDRTACEASDGLDAAGLAKGGRIELYGVDLDNPPGMAGAIDTSLHEFGHAQLGHSGRLWMDNDPTVLLRDMRSGTYDLQGAIADSNGLNWYAGDGIMGESTHGLNAVQRYELQWPERVLGKQEDRLVHLEEASVTFTSASTVKDLAVVEFPEPVVLPHDNSNAKTQAQKDYVKTQVQASVEELYFVANTACADNPSRTAPTMVAMYAREPISGDVVHLTTVAPALDEPEAADDNDFDYNDYDMCQPSAELIKRDYAANLHLGSDQYVTLSYDGEMNELSISKVFTQPRLNKPVAK